MAGERKGKTYEALVKVALDRLRTEQENLGEIFWNETPAGMTIEPDFCIGDDVNHPQIVILVTHSGSAKNSDMKFWRNMGELVEAKTCLATVPRVVNIAFDSIIKESLKKLQAAAFDGQVVVGDRDYGVELIAWVDQHLANLPTAMMEKLEVITEMVGNNDGLNRAISRLTEDLGKAITSTLPELEQLWGMEKDRIRGKAPVARDTYVRRGFTKRILLGNAINGGSIKSEDYIWAHKVGLLNRAIKGFHIVDHDLEWFMSSPWADSYEAVSGNCITQGFLQQVDKVRSIVLLEEYTRYVLEHLLELQTKEGMLEHLRKQLTNPAESIDIPEGVLAPQNIWLFDYIGALIKARTNRSQGFGYSTFAGHVDAKSSYIGSMDVGTWCSCFMNQYFNRHTAFNPPVIAEEYVANVLAEQLKTVSSLEISRLSDDIISQYIAKEYEATLLAHRGFDPLLAIMIHTGIIKASSRKTGISTCFAEKAGLGGQAGKTTVVKVKNTLINWQSVSDAGRDHKKKELCGRAVGLRYSWDAIRNQFVRRPGVNKLILVLDGTWRQKDLDALVRSGWDQIFYADELVGLAAAIM
ncbi:hypothetical protein E4K67_15110 [Desulfosporosinus fructosivorans]|uniref:Uncharacterized protein n=1 Tax=Desulfosporosinus fructosivorans TaxID=2018669 RepID=A0A4Z0R342_9FIRM|nr:hypothetical protein [Desulfosporosinus fructosivorans]TGE37200.1 hypothetical protein E4K67_15110 [Desulfosporosinus fructosivorans]